MKNAIRIKTYIFNSDHIEAIGWNEKEKTLVIETHKRAYEIRDVSLETWDRLAEMIMKS